MKNNEEQGFRTRLKEAMIRAKVSRKTLADECKVSVEAVRLWLSGSVPRPDQLRKAADCLHVTVLWLRDGIHPAEPTDGLNFDRAKVNTLPIDERERIENYIEFTLWRAEQEPAEEVVARQKKKLSISRPAKRKKSA